MDGLDANDPVNRRAIIREHLQELATYLGAEFSGMYQEGMILDAMTTMVLQALFGEDEE